MGTIITPNQLEKYLITIRDRSLSQNELEKKLVEINNFINWCKNTGKLTQAQVLELEPYINKLIHDVTSARANIASEGSKISPTQTYQATKSFAKTEAKDARATKSANLFENAHEFNQSSTNSTSFMQSRSNQSENRSKKDSLIDFNRNTTGLGDDERAKFSFNTFAQLLHFKLPAFITIVLFLLVLGLNYSQYFNNSKTNRSLINANASQNSAIGRTLSFQGKLNDSLGNPIDSKTDVTFSLYNSPTATTPIYSGTCQGTGGITPDLNGFFSVNIGGDCNMKPIPTDLFSDNTNVYLGIAVGSDAEMKPRQQIPNVGYSAASNSLQGLTVGTNTNNIPFINEEGTLLLGSRSPKIKASTGSFTIEGEALSFTTPEDDGGNISFSPGNSGNTLITTGSLGVGTLLPSAKLDISGDASISGNLTFRGIISQINQLNGGDITFATSYGGMETLVNRLVISNDGNVGIGTSNPVDKLTVNGNIVPAFNDIYSLGSPTRHWETIYANQIIASESGTIGFWQRTPGILNASTVTDDLILGSNSASNSLIKLAGSNNESSWLTGGNLGIGTRDPQAKFHITGAITGKALNIFDETGDQAIFTASASGTPKFVITHNGHVGINSVDPATDLDVNGTVRLSATGNATTNGLCHSGANSDTTFANRDVVACSSAPGDIAEWYETKSAEAGDIVIPSGENFTFSSPVVNAQTGELTGAHEDITTSIITRSQLPYQNSILGVISTSPYQTFGRAAFDTAKNPNPVALAGRVPVKVTTSNGVIKAGDPITASSIPGVGMKSTQPGVIVGRALESYTNADTHVVGKITLLVNVTWNDPQIRIAEAGDVAGSLEAKESPVNTHNLASSTIHEIAQSIIQSSLVANMMVDSITTKTMNAIDAQIGKLIVTDSVVSPVIETEKLSVNKIEPKTKNLEIDLSQNKNTQSEGTEKGKLAEVIIKGLQGKTVAAFDAAGNATLSGSLSANAASISGQLVADAIIADRIKSPQIDTLNTDLQDHTDRIARLNNNINDVQKELTDLRKESSTTVELPPAIAAAQTKLTNNNKLTSDELNITGTANVFKLYVTDSLTTGNIILQSDSILALSSTLNIGALDTVSFFGGFATIAKDGTITTEGSVVAKGGIQTPELTSLHERDNINIKLSSTEQNKLAVVTKERGEVAAISSDGKAHFAGISVDSYQEATVAGAIIAAPQNFKENGLYAPAIVTKRDTAGIGILPKDSDEVVLYNENINDNSLIYLTPIEQVPNGQLIVAVKQSCSQINNDTCRKFFKVSTDVATHSDIKFNWLIIN